METVASGTSESGRPSAKGKNAAREAADREAVAGGVGKTVTKKDLIDRITDQTKIKRQDVKAVVQEFLDQMVAELQAGNRLEFRDFGVFEIKARAPRVAQNPKTLERVNVPAKRTVKFKIGRLMRESLKPGRATLNGTANGTANGNHATVAVVPGLRPRSAT